MFHQTMFSCVKLCIQQSRRHFFLTKTVVLSASTRNFFATIAMHCNNMPLQVKNIPIVYVFCLHHSTQTSQETHAFFSRFKRSCLWLGCNWLILIHILFISFCGNGNYIWQMTFLNVLIFSSNQIGQPYGQPRWRIGDLHHLT